MIETFLLSIFMLGALWPYYIYLGVINYKKDPNALEDHLPGRPARRTIGRKNDDMTKGITYIILGYCFVNAGLYAFLDYKDLMPVPALVALCFAGLAIGMVLFTPANRMMHAYVTLGHIAVAHFIAMMATFLFLIAAVYSLNPDFTDGLAVLGLAAGAMLSFSKKPGSAVGVAKAGNKDKAEEF